MKWAPVLLLVVVGVALGDQQPFATRLEEDAASVDTNARMRAAFNAEHLKDENVRRRVFLRLAVDHEPEIRDMVFRQATLWASTREAAEILDRAFEDPNAAIRISVRHAALKLRSEDLQRLPGDRIASLFRIARDDDELERLVPALAKQVDDGAAVPLSALLKGALDAHSNQARRTLLGCAERVSRVAPISSDVTLLLTDLLASKGTREGTINLLVRARGPVAWKHLLEVEATSTDDAEQKRAGDALDRHEGRAKEYVSVLEEAAKSSPDSRVRDRTKKRLTGDR